MAIGSKQIGWSTESNLLWEIGKKLERLIKVAGSNVVTTTTTTTTAAP
jgi:N-acetylmuramoyl-L-alanine amidase